MIKRTRWEKDAKDAVFCTEGGSARHKKIPQKLKDCWPKEHYHYSTTTQGYTIYNIVAVCNGMIQINDLRHGIKGHVQVNICVQTRQGRKKTERKEKNLIV